MDRIHKRPEPAVLDTEAWDAPFHLSDDDLYLQAGGDRRPGGSPFDEREDDR